MANPKRTTPRRATGGALVAASALGQARLKYSGGFRPDWLPSPAEFYARELDKLKASSGGWASARCPFHDDRAPSLSVNLTTGAFLCHACGASGGDLIAFAMLRHGLGFKAAAESLGAWNHAGGRR